MDKRIYIYILLMTLNFCIPDLNQNEIVKYENKVSKTIFRGKQDPKKILYGIWFLATNQVSSQTQIPQEIQFTEEQKYDFTQEEIKMVEELQKSMEEEGLFTEEEFKKQEIGFTEIMSYEEQTEEEIEQEIEEWDRTGNIPSKVLTKEKIQELQEKEKKEIENFYKEMNSLIPELESFQLQNIKQNVVIAFYYYGIYKEIWEKSPIFSKEIMNQHTRNLWELRKKAIDELEKRGNL